MSQDIHLFVEYKENGEWKYAGPPALLNEQNYYRFGILCSGGRGVGILPEGIESITDYRGLPSDMSPRLQKVACDNYNCGHRKTEITGTGVVGQNLGEGYQVIFGFVDRGPGPVKVAHEDSPLCLRDSRDSELELPEADADVTHWLGDSSYNWATVDEVLDWPRWDVKVKDFNDNEVTLGQAFGLDALEYLRKVKETYGDARLVWGLDN